MSSSALLTPSTLPVHLESAVRLLDDGLGAAALQIRCELELRNRLFLSVDEVLSERRWLSVHTRLYAANREKLVRCLCEDFTAMWLEGDTCWDWMGTLGAGDCVDRFRASEQPEDLRSLVISMVDNFVHDAEFGFVGLEEAESEEMAERAALDLHELRLSAPGAFDTRAALFA